MQSSRSPLPLLALSAAAALAACGQPADVSPLVVMTQDLGMGADLDAVLATTAGDVGARVDAMWADRARSGFDARAAAIADGIGLFQPDLVGLQSAILWRQQLPASASPAEEVVSDHLALLLAALAARGLAYDPVAVTTTADVELTGASGNDYRLTDREVILAARTLTTSGPTSGTFTARRTVSLAGSTVELQRGWASIFAEREGKGFRFITAHLDSDGAVQREQGRQLVGIVVPDAPTLLAGNLGPETAPTYGMFLGGPLRVDLPGRAGSGVPSCCRDVALVNPAARLGSRNTPVAWPWTCTLSSSCSEPSTGRERL